MSNVSDPLNSLDSDGYPRRIRRDLPVSLDGERLARLETKVDLILEHQESARKLFEKHDDRLKHLENTKAGIYAVAATLGAVSAFLMDAVKHAFAQR
jgi:hypothetical protein